MRIPRLALALLVSGSLVVGCQPAAPKESRARRAPTQTPATAQARTAPDPAPTMTVASPIVQLVREGKVSPAQPAVHVFLWGHPETTDRDLKLAKEAGFVWVKQRFEWRYIEKTKKGAFEWHEPDRVVDAVNRAGLGMVVRLDNQPEWARRDGLFPASGPPDSYRDWEDYVDAVARRYRGKIAAYEIWNEPNLTREWGGAKPNPKDYTSLLKAAHAAIKRADPGALVISAGMSPTTESSERAMPATQFVEAMYAAGAKPYFDLLGAHAAGFKAEPEPDPALVAQDPALTNNDPSPPDLKRAYSFRHVEDLRAIMVKHGDDAKQVAIMEMGWTSDPRPDSPYAWHSVTEQQKGDYLVRALHFARQNWSPWVGMMTVLYLPSPTWKSDNEQYHWAIADPNGTPRYAYKAIKSMPRG